MFLGSFPVQQTPYYRVGNHIYSWVRLRPDRLNKVENIYHTEREECSRVSCENCRIVYV